MLHKLHKYGPVNTHDLLKFVAIITMVIDHIGLFFLPGNLYFRAIGRASGPIWFYLLGRYSPSRFPWKLAVYAGLEIALLSALYGHLVYQNILVSIIIIRLLLLGLEKSKITRWAHYLIPTWLALAFHKISIHIFQYGSMAFGVAYTGWAERQKFSIARMQALFIITGFLYILTQTSFEYQSLPMLVSVLAITPAMYALYRFKLRPLQIKNRFVGNAIMLLGRYSLEVYFYHFMAFALAAKYLRPEFAL